MKILLDTNVFIFQITGNLKERIHQLIEDPENEIYLSIISLWEILIKQGLGKIQISKDSPLEYLLEQRENHKITGLDFLEKDLKHLLKLPQIHKDPFDRLLICQCLENGFTFLTSDEILKEYPITIIEV